MYARLLLVLGLSALLLVGCTSQSEPDPPVLDCDPVADIDGDGIADVLEMVAGQDLDTDGDGLVDRIDGDSDGDGLPDVLEAGADGCTIADTDGDGVPDSRDADSDDDGLDDRRERELGTDPRHVDSDRDGVTDLGEVAGTRTDPLDPNEGLADGDYFVILQPGESVREQLRFEASIGRADVMLVVDVTSSMREERANLIRGLEEEILPGLSETVADLAIGLASVADYPLSPYGRTGNASRPGDRPLHVLRPIAALDEDLGAYLPAGDAESCPEDFAADSVGEVSGDPDGLPDMEQAVGGLPCHHGGDGPEAYLPALHALASGAALSWPERRETIEAPLPGCPAGTIGGACFRPRALPLMLLVGDNFFHQGPGDVAPYDFDAPDYPETVDALRAIGAQVLGLWSGDPGSGNRAHFEVLAEDTGAVDGDGVPLVFDVGEDGAGLNSGVVQAVADLVGMTPQTVGTDVEEGEGATFVGGIRPVDGVGPDGGHGYTTFDASEFQGVVPGAALDFEVTFVNPREEHPTSTEIVETRIFVIGNGVAQLDERRVFIVLPRADLEIII